MSQIPRDSTFPEGVNFSTGNQLFPRKSNFPEGGNFSRGSQLFPRESTFPRGSQLFPRKSNLPRSHLSWEVTYPSLSHRATKDEMTTDDDRVKCSPRPVGFAAGKNPLVSRFLQAAPLLCPLLGPTETLLGVQTVPLWRAPEFSCRGPGPPRQTCRRRARRQ